MSVCPLCECADAHTFIRFQQMPAHCNLLWPTPAGARQAPRGDIELSFCPRCGHIFNAAFDPALMEYSQDYENSLHFSPRFQQYATRLAEGLVSRYDLRDKEIVEIGAGQGDFLQMLCELGGNRGVGFDPSYVAKEGKSPPAEVRIVQDFYTETYADTPADFIVCRHVFEHIEDPAGFLRMVRGVIGDRAEIVTFFEVPNVLFTLRAGGIWDVIYEHCSYFSPHSLAYAFRQSGFEVLRLEEVFGGQFLTVEARPVVVGGKDPAGDVAVLQRLGADVVAFADRYRAEVQGWQQRLEEMAAQGRQAVVWGAGSKGVTFMNTLQPEGVIDYVVDINPRKRGMHVAGTGQEIVPPEALRTLQPDAVIIMNANYKDEIGQQLHDLGLDVPIWQA